MYQGRYQGMREHTSSPLRGSVFTIKKRRKFVLNWDTSKHIFQTPSLHTSLAKIITFIHSFSHSLIHSFCSLSYDKSIAPSKVNSPYIANVCILFQSIASSKVNSPYIAIVCILFQFPVPSLFFTIIQ